MRPPTPLWLAEPSRFAGLKRDTARWALGLLALLLAASFLALRAPGPPPVSHDPAVRSDNQADVMLYDGIVDAVRHGGNYYQVTADALRAGDYPLRPFVTFRLPTLAVAQALLPPWAVLALLYALVAGVFAAWFIRLRPAFARPPPLARTPGHLRHDRRLPGALRPALAGRPSRGGRHEGGGAPRPRPARRLPGPGAGRGGGR